MPTAIYDSSYLTFRKRAAVLYGYKANIVAAQNNNSSIVRSEQPTLQSGEIITTRKQGGCICANDAAGISVQANAPGPCGCSR
jgi:hypothetical protein